MKIKRIKKTNIIIMAEGKNQTEKRYLNSFNNVNNKFIIEFPSNSGYTDPENLLKAMIDYCKSQKLNKSNNHFAFIVIDIDDDEKKFQKIKKLQLQALKEKDFNIKFITSNPCFEIWFLLHLTYTTKEYKSQELKKEISKLIPNYRESFDIAPIILDKQVNALKNLNTLRKFYEKNQKDVNTIICNPHTFIDELINELENFK